MKELKLTKEKVAIVDDDVYDDLIKYKWSALCDGCNWYAYMTIGSKKNQKRLMLHRIIMLLTNPKVFCDHIDGNGLNNQRSNLRICTSALNSRNRRMKKTNTIGFKGVSYKAKHKKFQASINIDGKFIFGGHFDSAVDAAKKYNDLALQYHGEFAKLNTL